MGSRFDRMTPVGPALMPRDVNFVALLLQRVLDAAFENPRDVGDQPWSPTVPWRNSPRARLRDVAGRGLSAVGASRRRFDSADAAARLDAVLADADRLSRTYELLGDERSRALLLQLLAHRVLGPWHVALPVSPRDFVAAESRAGAAQVGSEQIPAPAGGHLHVMERDGIRIWAHPSQLVAMFDVQQYRYVADAGVVIEPAPGDVVVDGGAAFGETALVFARAVGTQGKVVALEMDDANVGMIRRNLEMNRDLAARVDVVAHPLWRDSQSTVDYTPAGGESMIGRTVDGDIRQVRTQALDDLGLERVDFLKLDIEGAELAALEGARAVLVRDRPRLAIAAYHRDDDLAAIPAFLDDLGVGYELYLGHFTPGPAETILFAREKDVA